MTILLTLFVGIPVFFVTLVKKGRGFKPAILRLLTIAGVGLLIDFMLFTLSIAVLSS